MDQLDQVHVHKQVNQKPKLDNAMEPSIARAQFASKRDTSFSSYLQPIHSNEQHQTKTHQKNSINTNPQNTTEDSDQISIFDAAKYFSDVNDDSSPTQNGSSKVLNLASMARLSSVSSTTETNSNYRVRSFHATPKASSEASWNSRTGLLANPPGCLAISIKSFSPNSSSNEHKHSRSNKLSTKWWRVINPKWLIPPRKCPCSGKKSVQVEERIEAKTPRMVDLRTSPSSVYSTRQNSHVIPNGFSSLSSNHKMIDSLKLVVDHSNDISTTSCTSSHGFTFPILEDQPVAVKKMFNVISGDHSQQVDPSRDSLEVFQPRSYMSPRSRMVSYEDENVSDGSSDLFEIESLSTITYPCRDSMEDENGVGNNRKKFGLIMSPTEVENDEGTNECYAPSEVSIDWSVTTVEGFDKASLTNFSVSGSDIGCAAMRRAAEKNGGGGGGGGGGKKNGGGNGGGLLMSCRCEKAVSVGPGSVKCPLERGPAMAARHVGGRPHPRQQGPLCAVAHGGGSGNGKVGLVVGRPKSSLVTMPFAT